VRRGDLVLDQDPGFVSGESIEKHQVAGAILDAVTAQQTFTLSITQRICGVTLENA